MLDKLVKWQANGCQGELSERSRIVFEARNRSAWCEDVFMMWQLQPKAAVC
jgi:hypothetical protein